jgi:hypothetical protein
MGNDIMHHLINNGSTANDTYTREQGKTVGEEEEEVEEEEGGEEEEEEPVVTAATTMKGKKKSSRRKEEATEVRSGDLGRMNASPRHGRW